MAGSCQRCGAAFGFMDRARGRTVCVPCQKVQQQERAQAKQAYTGLLRQAALGTVAADDVAADVAAWRAAAALAPADLANLNLQVWREAVETVLADDIVTQAEEDRLNSLGRLLRVDPPALVALAPDLAGRLMVARINDGRLPRVAVPKILLKRGETAHMEIQASLMKEGIERGTRGASSGMSFRVAKRVRFHTGGYRGQSVVLDSHLVVADQGTLTLTSTRAVFLGPFKTMELPYAKLLSVNVFNNGIQFQMSNRQSAPLFRVPDGNVVAAVVNAAYQKL